MPNIYISHGDKGGIGKSYIAAAIVDALLMSSPEKRVIIIDGDSGESTDRNNADVGPRFKHHPRVVSIVSPLNTPKAGTDTLYKALDLVFSSLGEDTSIDDVNFDIVVNTPANFGHTFDTETQTFFKQMADDTGMHIKIVYTVGQTALARSSASSFVEDSVFDPDDIRLALPTKETEEHQWLSDAKTAQYVQHGFAFMVPKMSYELVNIFDGNPEKSLAYFFSTNNAFDATTLDLRKKLQYRMIKNHSDEISNVLDKHLFKPRISSAK